MIYLDYSATTPLDPMVYKAMAPYFNKQFYNPASIHSLGQATLKDVEDARYVIADLLGASGTEIVFTSGATEANNLALVGLVKALKNQSDKRKHIISTVIEHSSILEPLNQLKKQGYKIDLLPVDKNGLVSLKTLSTKITNDTLLVTIGFVNSEIGSVQAIDRIGRMIRKINQHRYATWLKTSPRKRGDRPGKIYFHTDATQAFNVVDCKVNKLHVDLMSLSGHKIYGPKGIGLLFVKQATPLIAQQWGGHQERNLRSGTLNVPGIIGLTKAMIIADKQRSLFNKKIKTWRNYFIKEILKANKKILLTVNDLESISPMHASLIFPEVLGDALLLALDENGLAASVGSACASGDLSASPVIKSLGYKQAYLASALRFTFGRTMTLAQTKDAVKIVLESYKATLQRRV